MAHAHGRYLAILGHDMVQEHVLGTRPAWVFAPGGQEILWANAAGLAFLDIRSLDALARYRGAATSPVTSRIAQLAARKQGFQGGLERFRFFVGVRAKPAACLCQPLVTGDDEHCILAVAIDAPAGRGAGPGQDLLRTFDKAGLCAALKDVSGDIVASTTAFSDRYGASKDADDAGFVTIGADDGSAQLIIADGAARQTPDPIAEAIASDMEDAGVADTGSDSHTQDTSEASAASSVVTAGAFAAGALAAVAPAQADDAGEPAANLIDDGDPALAETGEQKPEDPETPEAGVDINPVQPADNSLWDAETADAAGSDTGEDPQATEPEADSETAAPEADHDAVTHDSASEADDQTADDRGDKSADAWMTAGAEAGEDTTPTHSEPDDDTVAEDRTDTEDHIVTEEQVDAEEQIAVERDDAVAPWMNAVAGDASAENEFVDPKPAMDADLSVEEPATQSHDDGDPMESSPDGPQSNDPTQEAMSADAERTDGPEPDPDTVEDVSSGSISDAISRLSIPLLGPDSESENQEDKILQAAETSDADPDAAEIAGRASPVPPLEPQATIVEDTRFDFVSRRAPHRFVWEMDADRQFSMVTPDLADAIGPAAADIVGKTWQQADAALALENPAIAAAIEAGETWTGMRVNWPVEGTDQMVPVELTALPIYDQNRHFAGYRGFGVCRTDRVKPDPMARGQGLARIRTSDTRIARDISDPSPPKTALADTDDEESHHAGSTAHADPIDRSVFVTPSLDMASEQEADQLQSGIAGSIPETDDSPETVERTGLVGVSESDQPSEAGDAETDAEAKPVKGLIAGLAGAALSALGMSASSRDTSPDEAASQSDLSTAQQDLTNETADLSGSIEEDAAETGLAETREPDSEASGQSAEGDQSDESDQVEEDDRAEANDAETIAPAPRFSSKDILALFVEKPAPDHEREAFSNLSAGVPVSDAGDDRPNVESTELSSPSGNDAGSSVAETEAEPDLRPETGIAVSNDGPETGQDTSPTAEVSRPGSEKPGDPPGTGNVVAMMPGPGSEPSETLKRLSRPEREAFQQIAQALGARLEGDDEEPPAAAPEVPRRPAIEVVEPDAPVVALPSAFATGRRDVPEGILLDRLPTGVLLCREADVLFANRAALDLLEYQSPSDLRNAGGLEAIFAEEGESKAPARPDSGDQIETPGRPITIRARSGTMKALFAKLYSVPWANDRALMIVFEPPSRDDLTVDAPVAAVPPLSLDAARKAAGRERIEELESILDTATDGVLVLTADGIIESANRSAEALFAADRADMIGRGLTDYLAPESHRSALDYLDGLARNGVESVLNDGREVIGQETSGGLIPMFMTIGRVNRNDRQAKFCAVLRDITQWKKAEEDLTSARRQAETASSQKSDFLAKISHEIRTPLNAIIGFSEVMLGERLGPIGTERYKEYLHDIRWSGDYIMSLINDLLDLSKIEAGKMDLTFEAVSVNDILKNCVALLQPEANRERIIIRTSLSESVPNVVADARSVQQIVLNLLSNAIKFNKRGGQVIVSSVYSEDGDVNVRVRDTGIGMSDEDLRLALEPFRQVQTTRSTAGGTGLGLPLTKALVEANRANFVIDSKPQEGTMVEITFPSPRVLAE